MTNGRARVLTMNRGSATLKSTLYEVAADASNRAEALLSISVTYSDTAGARLKIADVSGAALLDAPVAGRD